MVRTKATTYVEGSTAWETMSVILTSWFYVFIAYLISTSWFSKHPEKLFYKQRFALEFIFIVIPIILDVTVLVPYTNQILVSLFAITLNIYIIVINRKSMNNPRQQSSQKTGDIKYPFVTSARALIYLISVICILAVDFTIFPKHFGKTTEYGFSLMDVGVGLFIYSNGGVSPEVRGHKDSFMKTVKGVIPLLFLGGGRFFVTKQIDYYVPVLEYGVHWNFFITLAVVKLLSSFILKFMPIKYSLHAGVTLLVVHEIILQSGFADYVFSNSPRNTLFSANREGIFSILGYLGLYFTSIAFGIFVDVKSNALNVKAKRLYKLITLTCILLSAAFILKHNFGISRRLANFGYCVWISFIGCCMFTLIYIGEVIIENHFGFVKVPLILESLNFNGLLFFLLGNILTGLINLSVETSNVKTVGSLAIIAGYMLINCGFMCRLFIKQKKLRF